MYGADKTVLQSKFSHRTQFASWDRGIILRSQCDGNPAAAPAVDSIGRSGIGKSSCTRPMYFGGRMLPSRWLSYSGPNRKGSVRGLLLHLGITEFQRALERKVGDWPGKRIWPLQIASILDSSNTSVVCRFQIQRV